MKVRMQHLLSSWDKFHCPEDSSHKISSCGRFPVWYEYETGPNLLNSKKIFNKEGIGNKKSEHKPSWNDVVDCKQSSGLICTTFWEDPSCCCLENILKESKNESWETSRKLLQKCHVKHELMTCQSCTLLIFVSSTALWSANVPAELHRLEYIYQEKWASSNLDGIISTCQGFV